MFADKYNMSRHATKNYICLVLCIKLQFPFPLPIRKKLYIVHKQIERLQPVSNKGTLSEMNIFMYYEQYKLPGLLMLVDCPLDQPFMVLNGTQKPSPYCIPL